MSLIIPKSYHLKLLPETTEVAIKMIKDTFQAKLSKALKLRRVTAPLFVLSGTGINDDLNGVEHAVAFNITALGGKRAEVVHSLAKWKRAKLASYGIVPGYGLYTDMNAIRADEELDNLHSIYVDQWDWEKSIEKADRTLDYLKATVKKIYEALKETEQAVYERFPHTTPRLPEEIHFVHSEELATAYPDKTPKEREAEVAKKYGAVFVIGIGGKLSDGKPHDLRAADYDDWSLNGDIVIWNEVLQGPFELSSMGIRVDESSLRAQLREKGEEYKEGLEFHSRLLSGQLPYTIGGGIGQSRLCMLLLRKAHIGEIQSSIWPETMREECRKSGIELV